MPLVRYEIRNEYSLANPELYRAASKDDPEALLEGVAMAGLVGIVRQLGDLAEFAAEVFHDLHEEVMATAARSHELLTRVQQLEAEIPAIENFLLSETNQLRFAYTQGAEWHASIHIDQNHLTQGDLPWFIRNSYEECRGPPRLFLLDKFDVAGAGACLKRYTDPSFFKTEWASTELLKAEKEKRDKKARKVKKKGRRRRSGETKDGIYISQFNPRVHYSSLNIENMATVSGNASLGLNSGLLRRKATVFPTSQETAMGDHMQASSSKTNQDNIESDTDSQLWTVESVADVTDSEAFKVSAQDIEAEILSDIFSQVEHSVAVRETEGSESEIKPVSDVVVDEAASDTEQFVDALTTMESEVDTDTESKQKLDLDSDSYLETRESVQLHRSLSEENEALQEHVFEVEKAQEHTLDAEQDLISIQPATEIVESLERKVHVSSTTGLSETRIFSSSLDRNKHSSHQNILSLSSEKKKMSSLEEGKYSPLMDEIHATCSLDENHLLPSLDENSHTLSHDEHSPSISLYENSLALSFDENRVSSSFDENTLSSGEISVSPSFDENKVSPLDDNIFSASFDVNNDASFVDENIIPSFPVKNSNFPVPAHDENNLAPASLCHLETRSADKGSGTAESSEADNLDNAKQDDLPTSFHLLPAPAIPLVNGNEGGRAGYFGSLASHKKGKSSEMSIEKATSSVEETQESDNLMELERGVVETPQKLLAQSFVEPTYEPIQAAMDSSTFQDNFDDDDDFDGMMQVSSGPSSSSHSVLSTPLMGNTEFQMDSETEPKSPLSSQLSLDSSSRSPRFNVLDSPTSPVKLSSDLVEPQIQKVCSEFLIPSSPTLSPMAKPEDFTSSTTSSSITSPIVQSEDLTKPQRSPMLSPMAKPETLQPRPNSPTLCPMAKPEELLPRQNSPMLNPMVTSNVFPLSPSSPVLRPMVKPEELPPPPSFVLLSPKIKQGELPLPPNFVMLSPAAKQEEFSPPSSSLMLNPVAMSDELPPPTVGMLTSVVKPQGLLPPPGFSIISYVTRPEELPPVTNSSMLSSMIKPEELPPPPPLPPLEWRVRSRRNVPSSSSSKTLELSAPLRSASMPSLRLIEPPTPPAFPIFPTKLEKKLKPTPLAYKNTGGKDPLIEAIASHKRSSLKKITDQHRSPIPKPLDEREVLLEQIRTRSFSLRHTVVEKHEDPRPVTNINVAAILEKANAIRQAFAGSDEDDEDDDWSDS